jgi:hypothetical protein
MRFGRGAAWVAAVCVFVPGAAQAALWAADPSMELTGGGNDNYGLALDRRNRVGLASVTGGLALSRETEASVTRLDAGLVGLLLRGDLHQDEWQDHVTLSQTLKAPVDSFAFDARSTRDETLQTPASSADVLIGRGLQRSNGGDASWDHRFTERLSASGTLAINRTRYSATLAGARDYQNGSGSASLRYLLDERDSVNATLVHQDYRTLDDDVRSLTDSVTVGGTRALSETSSASVTLGAYRGRTAVVRPVLACPTGASTCAEPVVVAQLGRDARWGAQYNVTWSGQLTERTHADVHAVRQQDPSGAGVTVLSDSVSAGVQHAWSETLDGSLTFTHASSRYQGLVLGGTSRLETLAAALSKSLSPQLTLRANAEFRRSTEAFDGLRAHSTGVSLTLRYEWLRLDARH